MAPFVLMAIGALCFTVGVVWWHLQVADSLRLFLDAPKRVDVTWRRPTDIHDVGAVVSQTFNGEQNLSFGLTSHSPFPLRDVTVHWAFNDPDAPVALGGCEFLQNFNTEIDNGIFVIKVNVPEKQWTVRKGIARRGKSEIRTLRPAGAGVERDQIKIPMPSPMAQLMMLTAICASSNSGQFFELMGHLALEGLTIDGYLKEFAQRTVDKSIAGGERLLDLDITVAATTRYGRRLSRSWRFEVKYSTMMQPIYNKGGGQNKPWFNISPMYLKIEEKRDAQQATAQS